MNTKREKPVVEMNGFLMRQHQPNANGMLMLWRCADVNKYKCRARGTSLIDSREVALTAGHNGHLPDPSLATKYRVNTEVKAAAKANILVPSGQIVDHHTAGLNGEELNKLARRSVIQKIVNRARKHSNAVAKPFEFRAFIHPADAFRQRRRPKTMIRDAHIKALVEEYVALPAAQRNRAAMANTLALIQHHLSA